jgi:L-seryl-tRNA(Ser) seleniumtransferase
LPPAENLRRFIAEGADLVCFSGGKALGGPQSSGILAGRRDLVSSALAQMLDLDMPEAEFIAPAEFSPLAQMRGLPHHGIGRSCKIGKEEIIGLIVALRRFVADNPDQRSAHWQARLEAVLVAAGHPPNLRLVPGGAKPGLPILEWRLPDAATAQAADARLRARRPASHVDASRITQGLLAINPIAFDDGDAALLGAALKECAA